MAYRYYLTRLSKTEAELYSVAYKSIKETAQSFRLDASVASANKIIRAVVLDHPELHYFEGKWKAAVSERGILVIPNYKKEGNRTTVDALIDKATELICRDSNGSVEEKIKKVYDWILENVRYSRGRNDQTVEGVFVDKNAVCKGIAKAFQLLMNRLGIPSLLVKGTIDGNTPHIWNIVCIDRRFYHVDVTMGYSCFRGIFHGSNRNKHYPCFLVSDKTISLTHKKFCEDVPACTEDFDIERFLTERLCIPDKLKKYGSLCYLDKGSTCTVLQIRDGTKRYALKVIEAGRNAYRYRRASAELEKLKLLENCNGVVKLEDYVVNEDGIYLLMPYCKPLSVRRRERDFDSIKDTLKLGMDILEAMAGCRAKEVFHLDIQPKNIYFDESGRAVLGDFGGAAFAWELKRLNPRLGTLAFMAPEVYHMGLYGETSELYSLGIVLYSLLNCAKLPFTEQLDLETAIRWRLGGTELPKPSACDEALWQIIDRMCCYHQKDRYATYEEAKEALQKALAQLL